MKNFRFIAFAACALIFSACSSDPDEPEIPDPDPSPEATGLFIVNQGNFQYGNSSLTFYSPDDDVATQDNFFRANGFKLGDLAQSMTIDPRGNGWIVVNNSNVIFSIDTSTYVETGRVTGIISPRFIHFVSDTKAYVTALYDNRIAIVDPQKHQITGYITIPDMDPSTGSTEMMVQVGKYVYVNCWSYNNRIIRIDSDTDLVDGYVETPIQPKAMTLDADNNIWAITDGGYYGSPYGYEQPALVRINTSALTVDLTLRMEIGANITSIVTDGTGTQLYWICNDIYTMPITSSSLPDAPLISSNGNWFMGLTVDPVRGDIYIADALDYVQPGQLLRYSADGNLITTVPTGVIPGAFCWKK